MADKTDVLYIAYDGMTDPLGQSQVLSYLRQLSKNGYRFHVLSFEKPELYAKNREDVLRFIDGYDIVWHPLKYTNRPPIVPAIINVRKGKNAIRALMQKYDIRMVHCRSYIPAILGEWMQKEYGVKFLFDMRGWWPDEKKESGAWNSAVYQPVYNYFKKRELGFFRKADFAISLTHIGKKHIVSQGLKDESKVAVIPTCVNFNVFPAFDETMREEVKKELQIDADAAVMIYSGSLGGNYRTDLTLRFFKSLLKYKSNAIFLFISHTDPLLIENEIAKSGLSRGLFRTVSCTYHNVHRYLMAGDYGVIMYNTDFSVIGRSPTKLGEYWACGLYMLSAKGIGDLEYICSMFPNSGALVEDMNSEAAYDAAITKLLQLHTAKNELREYAKSYYDLETGVNNYLKVYKNLLGV